MHNWSLWLFTNDGEIISIQTVLSGRTHIPNWPLLRLWGQNMYYNPQTLFSCLFFLWPSLKITDLEQLYLNQARLYRNYLNIYPVLPLAVVNLTSASLYFSMPPSPWVLGFRDSTISTEKLCSFWWTGFKTVAFTFSTHASTKVYPPKNTILTSKFK